MQDHPIVRSRSALVLLAAGAATVLVPAPAAYAASGTCAERGGVTVVVDPGDLTAAEPTTACVDPGPGVGVAEDHFTVAGHEHEFVQRIPGMVCRVDGEPADQSCAQAPSADAYWGLYWSAEDAQGWKHADLGVTELEVPAGGSVAWAWQDGDEPDLPSVPPGGGSAEPAEGDETSAESTAGSTAGSGTPDADTGDPESAAAPDGLPTWLVLAAGLAIALAVLVLALRRRAPHQE